MTLKRMKFYGSNLMDEYKSIGNSIVIVDVRFTIKEVNIACQKKEEWFKENQMKKTMH